MPNGHWSIPFSVAFVIKKIEGFEPDDCSINTAMTLILRMKFTGMPEMEKIINWVKENCKVRVNKVEGKIIEEEQGRSGKVNHTKSSDWTDGPNDML